MHRAAALLLILLLAVAACTDGEAAPSPDPTVAAAAATPTTPPPDPAPPTEEPQPEAEEPELAPGRTDAFVVPGDPTLLALGDSVAAGTGLTDLRDGFVWRVHGALAEEQATAYGLANLAVAGATSSSLHEEQLPQALATIAAGPVDTIILSVGGNDLLGLFAGGCRAGLGSPACATAIDEAVVAFTGNLERSLADLRAAAPEAAIVLLAVYNPFDLGTGSRVELLAAETTSALNAAAGEVAQRHGVHVADGYAALEGRIAETTGMAAEQPDIHPTALGHDRLARAILAALRGDSSARSDAG